MKRYQRRILGHCLNAVVNVLVLVGLLRRWTRFSPEPHKGLHLERPPRPRPRGLDRL